jgi:DNA polymerase III subunit epsilon
MTLNIREIILDTETTGLNPYEGHRIVEICALEMVNRVLTGNKFHFYVNPERDMPEEAYRIHGISSSLLEDKPFFRDIVDDFLKFIENGKLVIHNAPFDIKFLNYELSLLNLSALELSEAVDTLKIARKKYPGARVNLDALCRRFKIDNSAREFHGALLDAALLAEVYVELTGGRQTSFELSNNKLEEYNSNAISTRAEGNGLVIYPTEEELEKHKEFLKRFIC